MEIILLGKKIAHELHEFHEKISPQITQIDTEGMASPTYYCGRNTHMQEQKSWNKNKVSA